MYCLMADGAGYRQWIKVQPSAGRLLMTIHRILFFSLFATFSAAAQAAFIVQPDVDGSSSGTAITINSHLTFGNSTSPPGVSTPSAAAGLQPGNSIFGGASPTVDQYI